MKYLATLFLVVSLGGVGVFGSAVLDMGPSHSGGCIASAVDGGICPTSIVDMTLHHISVIQALTTTVLPVSSLIFLIAFLLLASISILLFHKKLLYPKFKLLVRRIRELALDSLYTRQTVTSWLSLFELSPAL